ncbi:MAG: hypothetical protein KDK65_01415 [Chlamydiia bacterium]|nr:hypothetical protein [Chlamydiia bacterium]
MYFAVNKDGPLASKDRNKRAKLETIGTTVREALAECQSKEELATLSDKLGTLRGRINKRVEGRYGYRLSRAYWRFVLFLNWVIRRSPFQNPAVKRLHDKLAKIDTLKGEVSERITTIETHKGRVTTLLEKAPKILFILQHGTPQEYKQALKDLLELEDLKEHFPKELKDVLPDFDTIRDDAARHQVTLNHFQDKLNAAWNAHEKHPNRPLLLSRFFTLLNLYEQQGILVELTAPKDACKKYLQDLRQRVIPYNPIDWKHVAKRTLLGQVLIQDAKDNLAVDWSDFLLLHNEWKRFGKQITGIKLEIDSRTPLEADKLQGRPVQFEIAFPTAVDQHKESWEAVARFSQHGTVHINGNSIQFDSKWVGDQIKWENVQLDPKCKVTQATVEDTPRDKLEEIALALPTIVNIDLSAVTHHDVGEALSFLPDLKDVVLPGNFPDDDLEPLVAALVPHTLKVNLKGYEEMAKKQTTWFVQWPHVAIDKDAFAKALKLRTGLKTLTVTGTNTPPFAAFAAAYPALEVTNLKWPSETIFDLSDNTVSFALHVCNCAQKVEHLTPPKAITPEQLQSLAQRKISCLDLSKCTALTEESVKELLEGDKVEKIVLPEALSIKVANPAQLCRIEASLTKRDAMYSGIAEWRFIYQLPLLNEKTLLPMPRCPLPTMWTFFLDTALYKKLEKNSDVKVLDLSDQMQLTDQTLSELIDLFPNVEELRIQRCQQLTEAGINAALKKLPTSCQSVYIGGNAITKFIGVEPSRFKTCNVTHTSFSHPDCTMDDPHYPLACFLHQVPTEKTAVKLSGSPLPALWACLLHNGAYKMLEQSFDVSILNLDGQNALTDEALKALIPLFPKLKQLRVRGCEKLTQDGLAAALAILPTSCSKVMIGMNQVGMTLPAGRSHDFIDVDDSNSIISTVNGDVVTLKLKNKEREITKALVMGGRATLPVSNVKEYEILSISDEDLLEPFVAYVYTGECTLTYDQAKRWLKGNRDLCDGLYLRALNIVKSSISAATVEEIKQLAEEKAIPTLQFAVACFRPPAGFDPAKQFVDFKADFGDANEFSFHRELLAAQSSEWKNVFSEGGDYVTFQMPPMSGKDDPARKAHPNRELTDQVYALAYRKIHENLYLRKPLFEKREFNSVPEGEQRQYITELRVLIEIYQRNKVCSSEQLKEIAEHLYSFWLAYRNTLSEGRQRNDETSQRDAFISFYRINFM